MSRQDIEFKTYDNLALRGWLYTPSATGEQKKKLPCIVLSHGWSAVKEMGLDTFAEAFIAKLQIVVLVYDQRSFGASDTGAGQPNYEIIPSVQISDLQDAITFAQGLDVIDPTKIAIWGSSYSGGHVLQVAAIDKRVKAAISQVPMVNGWETSNRLIRPDIMPGLDEMWQKDRLARAAGQPAAVVPVSDANPLVPCALPSADSFAFFKEWEPKLEGKWKNEVTIRSLEACRAYDPSTFIARIAPTPLLMIVARKDCVTPTDIALNAYSRANEPKQLVMLDGGHFDAYAGANFTYSVGKQIEFLQHNLI